MFFAFVASVQGMMACPVCSGAFSWREDLLHHFGSVHHLEELIAHLDSEFTCESCPPCCRVPRSLFKYHVPETANSVPSSVRAGDSAQCKNHGVTTKCLNTNLSVGKTHRSDDTQANETGGTNTLDSRSSVKIKLTDDCAKSIERYHCDLCEFSANDIQQLVEHGSEHASHRMPSPGHLFADVTEEASREHLSDVSPSTQVQDRYFCDQCPFFSKYQRTLKQHLEAHSRSASVKIGYRCGYCKMASPYRGSISAHLVGCHRGQPVKILQFSGDKVINVMHDSVSASKTVKSSSSSARAIQKRRKLKMSKSNLDTGKVNSCSAQKILTNKETGFSLTMNRQVLNGDKEGSTEMLESKLPAQMIYRKPVRCPSCHFHNRARVNLVRHIRLVHSNSRQSPLTSSSKSWFSNFIRANYDDVDLDNPASVPLQVYMFYFSVCYNRAS